ncbi:hypothetical protein DKX38_007835 [Salix brachista]|uniref:Uncharacterized protein n=1 Tax=Salix brachista TaxID=2182728 RepID=A0A5N5MRV3_9ROSI|nr:hypothetical protein DKX38_007835 [Salix brachista]
MEYFIKLIKKKHVKDVSKDNRALGKLKRESRFEELNNDLFRKTMGPLLKDYFNGKEPNKGVNPDEVVAYGVAIQGGILSGEVGDETKDILLLDVTPFTVGGVKTKLIPRNSVIPTKNSKMEVTFEVDANSILNVKAEDKAKRFEQMVQEAEEFAEEDRKVKEKIDARNILETYVYNMKNQVNDKDKLADKLQADEKEIETAVKEAVKW